MQKIESPRTKARGFLRGINKSIFILTTMLFICHAEADAYSTRHHLINMGKRLISCVSYPLRGVFIKGPANIKAAYEYEVHGREKPENRGLLRYKLFALWRAPGEETKGIIDGVVDGVGAGGKFFKEFISIFFGD